MRWKDLVKDLSAWPEAKLNEQVLLGLEEEQTDTRSLLREVTWLAVDATSKKSFLLAARCDPPDKEFKLVHVADDPNDFGLYEHVWIARDGTAWRTWSYRGPGGKTYEAGDKLMIPYEDGKPAFFRSSFEVAEPILTGVASAAVVREVWGVDSDI